MNFDVLCDDADEQDEDEVDAVRPSMSTSESQRRNEGGGCGLL